MNENTRALFLISHRAYFLTRASLGVLTPQTNLYKIL